MFNLVFLQFRKFPRLILLREAVSFSRSLRVPQWKRLVKNRNFSRYSLSLEAPFISRETNFRLERTIETIKSWGIRLSPYFCRGKSIRRENGAGLFPRPRGNRGCGDLQLRRSQERTKPVSKYTLISCRANNQARKPAIYTGETCVRIRNYHLDARSDAFPRSRFSLC